MAEQVDQKEAVAGRDIIAGDKIDQHFHSPRASASVVEKLLQKLLEEVQKNERVQHTIEALAHFQTRRAHDGIEGLEEKLKAGGRETEILDAVEKKELFAKLLERWSLYASAQEVFACFLAKAEYEFSYFILPQIDELSQIQVNQLVLDRIIIPTINECGTTVFVLNHSQIMGMVYWLAEQCFVRWHK